MRVNIYAEELTDRVELIRETPRDEMEVPYFYAVRLYLGLPFEHRPGDDDSSAVTFWVPWTRAGGHDFDQPIAILRAMAGTLEAARDNAEDGRV